VSALYQYCPDHIGYDMMALANLPDKNENLTRKFEEMVKNKIGNWLDIGNQYTWFEPGRLLEDVDPLIYWCFESFRLVA
jgi:hypothetical protein